MTLVQEVVELCFSETSLDNNNRFPRRGGGGMVTSPTPMMKNLPPSGRMSVDHVREREEERLQIHPMTVMLNNSLRIDQVFTDAGKFSFSLKNWL